jgi:hypothetical protein
MVGVRPGMVGVRPGIVGVRPGTCRVRPRAGTPCLSRAPEGNYALARQRDAPTGDEWPQLASQQSQPEKDPNMLWTILIIVLIVLVVMAIFGRGRLSR